MLPMSPRPIDRLRIVSQLHSTCAHILISHMTCIIPNTAAAIEIVSALEKSRNAATGSSGFEATDFEDVVEMILDKFKLDKRICRRDARLIWRQAAFAISDKKITVERLDSAARSEVSKFLRRKPKPYILATSISLKLWAHRVTRRIGSSSITITRSLPLSFDQSNATSENGQYSRPKPFDWFSARVRADARSHMEAFDTMMNNLDFVRGIWNYLINHSTWRAFSSDETRPLNRILPGPIHTLHFKSGKPATSAYWYEPNFREQTAYYPSSEDWRRIENGERRIRKRLRDGGLGPQIEGVLIRYCRALDGRDAAKASLQLWGILETLTGVDKQKTASPVSRAMSTVPKGLVTPGFFDVLRERRNLSVHQGVEDDEQRSTLSRINWLVTQVISVALGLSREFSSPSEFGEFLDLPSERSVLKKQIQRRQLALKFNGLS